MRVYLGSDHAGFELKAAIIAWLGEAGHEAVDCGPARYDPEDDYPVFVMRAAEGVIGHGGSPRARQVHPPRLQVRPHRTGWVWRGNRFAGTGVG